MKKQMLAGAVVLAMLSTTGAFCMAKDEGTSIQMVGIEEKEALTEEGLVELDLDDIDIPDVEKQALQQDLQELNNSTDKPQKEKLWTKIKNWFKENPRRIWLSSVLAPEVLLIIGLSIAGIVQCVNKS